MYWHHHSPFHGAYGYYHGGFCDPGMVWPLLLIIAVVGLVAVTDRRRRK